MSESMPSTSAPMANLPTVAGPSPAVTAMDGPPTIESLQQQLQKQKETMKQWKDSVKAQLMEAQSKNKMLKEERDAARAQLTEAENGARMRLQTEFNDRLVAKDEEIRRVTEALAAARAQRQADADDHYRTLEAQKEQFQQEAKAVAAEANATFNAEIIALEKQIAEAKNETAAVQHDLSVQVAKTIALEGRLREVTSAAASTAAIEAPIDKANAAKLDNELRLALAELNTARAEVEAGKRRLTEVQSAHAASLAQKVQEEVQQRDDQLNVLQVLLRQSQSDVGTYQQRCIALQGQLDEERDARESKLAAVRHELLAKIAAIEELTKSNEGLKSTAVALQGAIALLEEEKEVRERAFAEIFLSDDQKQMIKVLEDQLRDSQLRATEAAESRQALQEELKQAKSHNVEVLRQAACEREQLAEQKADIEVKLQRLAQQEKRTKEQCDQLAQQAERVRAALGGNPSGHYSGKGSKAGGSKETAAVPVLEMDEFGRVLRTDGSGGGALDGGEFSGDTGTLTSNLEALIDNLKARHQWANAASNVVTTFRNNIQTHLLRGGRGGGTMSTYQQYRKVLPVIMAICFLMTFLYYYLFSSTSAKVGQTLKVVEVQETVALIRQQYNSLVGKYNQCCGAKEALLPMDATRVAK